MSNTANLPVSLKQLQLLQALLDAASAREADPDAEVFKLLDAVRKTRGEAVKSKNFQEVQATTGRDVLIDAHTTEPVFAHNLMPGKVPAEQFVLLLAGTDIRGPKVAEALRLHLVDGLTPKEACEQTGANRGQFSLRLKAIHEENHRVNQLLKFYGRQ